MGGAEPARLQPTRAGRFVAFLCTQTSTPYFLQSVPPSLQSAQTCTLSLSTWTLTARSLAFFFSPLLFLSLPPSSLLTRARSSPLFSPAHFNPALPPSPPPPPPLLQCLSSRRETLEREPVFSRCVCFDRPPIRHFFPFSSRPAPSSPLLLFCCIDPWLTRSPPRSPVDPMCSVPHC